MAYVSHVDVSAQVGQPMGITYDSVTTNLYVTGVHGFLSVSIARLTTALAISKFNNNIYSPSDPNNRPLSVSPGFTGSDWVISGGLSVLRTVETGGGFNAATTQAIAGEVGTQFVGHIKHSSNVLFMLKNKNNTACICKVDNTYTNVGDSDKISKSVLAITEGASASLLVVNTAGSKILRYDSNMNFVETVYEDTGATVALDAQEITDLVEF